MFYLRIVTFRKFNHCWRFPLVCDRQKVLALLKKETPLFSVYVFHFEPVNDFAIRCKYNISVLVRTMHYAVHTIRLSFKL
jgi:hypothetical protein